MILRRVVMAGLGLAVVAAVVLTVGTEPFLRGLASLSAESIGAAAVFTAIAIAAAATRWWAVSEGLGVPLRWRDALAGCYRSTFLNSVLPGGIGGDVHRAYRHGTESGSRSGAARAVVTERVAGQAVQLVIAVAVLVAVGLAIRLQSLVAVAVGVVLVAAIIVALIPRARRAVRHELALQRQVFASARRAAIVVVSSVVVLAALTTVFVIACLAVGVDAPPARLLAAALVVLTAGALPFNVAGWGPREAAAASVFAAAGLGSQLGVAASTAFGVLSLIAVLPGALLLLTRVPSPITEESPA